MQKECGGVSTALAETTVERPILFAGEMMRAIVDGRKTQTRRVLRRQPQVEVFPFLGRDNKPTGEFAFADHPRVISKHITCPYGKPGDRLWVRETWTWGTGPVDDAPPSADNSAIIYREDWERDAERPELSGLWKPSIHMHRWASRITLEVTDVRVERVQDIGYDEAIAEGIPTPRDGCPIEEFSYLWDSINAGRGYGWEANPWVWVISFKRISRH